MWQNKKEHVADGSFENEFIFNSILTSLHGDSPYNMRKSNDEWWKIPLQDNWIHSDMDIVRRMQSIMLPKKSAQEWQTNFLDMRIKSLANMNYHYLLITINSDQFA